MPNPTQEQEVAQTGGAYGNTRPKMVEEPKERIIIALLERHYCSLSTLEQEVENLEVKLEPVTKTSGLHSGRSETATNKPPPVPDDYGWNDDSSRTTRMIGEMGQRIIALSGRISGLTDFLET